LPSNLRRAEAAARPRQRRCSSNTATRPAIYNGLNLTTGFGYNTTGDRTSLTDPRNFITTSIFDADGRKTEDDHHTIAGWLPVCGRFCGLLEAQGARLRIRPNSHKAILRPS